MTEPARPALRAARTLAVVGVIGLGGLLALRELTAERIAAREREAAIAAIAALLPRGVDNDPNGDAVRVHAPAWLGSDDAMTVRRARGDGELRGLLVEAVAPDGYNGDIRLLLGVAVPGTEGGRQHPGAERPTIVGVRVVEHRETPGLGDYIDAARSAWIDQFDGRSLRDPALDAWRVERDGGRFDAVAGATISARAVVDATRRALQFVDAHAAAVGGAAAGTTLHFTDAPPFDAGADGRARPTEGSPP